MIVLDASVVIAHLSPGDSRAERAMEILDTEEELGMHPLTVAEVLVRPAQDGAEEDVAAALGRLGIEQLPVERDEPIRIARVRAGARIRMPDACVLAAALRSGAAVATFDVRLARAAESHGIARLLT